MIRNILALPLLVAHPSRTIQDNLLRLVGRDAVARQMTLVIVVPLETNGSARMHRDNLHGVVLQYQQRRKTTIGHKGEAMAIQIDYMVLADAATAADGKLYIQP